MTESQIQGRAALAPSALNLSVTSSIGSANSSSIALTVAGFASAWLCGHSNWQLPAPPSSVAFALDHLIYMASMLAPAVALRPQPGQPEKNVGASGSYKMDGPGNGDLERRLVNHIALVHETDQNGVITRVNAMMCAKTGYTEQELVGASHQLICPDLAADASWLGLHRQAEGSEFLSGETLNRSKDSSDLWLSTTALPVYFADGALKGYYFVSMDITEQKKLHEEFQRSGKLMQLGQLTAMVAHEIRNPLGAIRTANYVLERKLNGQIAGVEPQLERINVSIRRCDKIITELLDFSKKKAVNSSTLPVDKWLSETVEEVGKSLPGSPQLSVKLGLKNAEATFDPEQLRQVVINLLSNAAEAIGEKIKCGTAEPDYQPAISIETRQEGALMQIIVTDNGPGIEPKNIKRVREPLFTTKSFGVGLGISAIEKILQDHRGSLGIESTLGAGATMTASFHKEGPALPAA